MIVLDTHAWIWWIGDPDSLSPTARNLIEKEIDHTQVYISSISAWEVALLVSRGRLRLSMDVETFGGPALFAVCSGRQYHRQPLGIIAGAVAP